VSDNREHEIGYEHLTYEEWAPLTGLPREAYEEWLTMDEASRRDVVGVFATPEQIQAVRDAGRET